MIRRMAMLVFLVACGGGSSSNPDASAIDDAAHTPDAGVCAHTLFLNFGGDTVMVGLDNATTDHTSIATSNSTIPPFSENNTAQAGIVTQVQTTLAPYGVDVVTTRPASGDYDMILFGGTAADIGLSQQGITAIIPSSNCGAPTGHDLGFVFEAGAGDVEMANFAVALFGLAWNVPMSTQSGDCMCFAAAGCGNNTAACTVGGASTPRDSEAGSCGSGATFDEGGAFTSDLACP